MGLGNMGDRGLFADCFGRFSAFLLNKGTMRGITAALKGIAADAVMGLPALG
jgi:hypothetical protein